MDARIWGFKWGFGVEMVNNVISNQKYKINVFDIFKKDMKILESDINKNYNLQIYKNEHICYIHEDIKGKKIDIYA